MSFCGHNEETVDFYKYEETSSSDKQVQSTKSNSNSLVNQLGIHLILAKQEKLASNSLENQLGKTHLPARIYARANRGCHRHFPLGGRVKKEIKNREGFLM
jgi:hypothetical protein